MANEKRLIDANVTVAVFTEWLTSSYDGRMPRDVVTEIPTVDAVEVVHAQWLYDSGSGKYFCSACDEYALSFKKDTLYGGDLYEVCLTDYCPNCGTKMDGDGNGT